MACMFVLRPRHTRQKGKKEKMKIIIGKDAADWVEAIEGDELRRGAVL